MQTFPQCPACAFSRPRSDVFRCAKCSAVFCTNPHHQACQGRCPKGCGSARQIIGRTAG
jgi:hypothetical protein